MQRASESSGCGLNDSMSGIGGILNLDGAPIDRVLLKRLTNSLLFRGPDAQRMWFRGQIGFGHTLLRSTTRSEDDGQPLSLDGQTWIVSDARVDGRRDLIATLQPRDYDSLAEATDAELILRAYHAWGEKCLEHLIGDFVFAIWNSRTRSLFCARDQMGIKPFFYAHLGPLFIFSNTLDCIRQHPAVSDRLNDLSIADFLLFDLIQDASATAFAEIQRLPPAHSLLCEQDALSIRRYWQPSITSTVHYRRAADYVDRFNELLDTAVADRLRAKSACIFMSGGLDSPTVAASAMRVSARSGGTCSPWAYTQVFDSLIPHDERHYAGLVADALKIPIEYRADDHLRLFQFAEQPEYRSPEPVHTAWPDVTTDQLRRVETVSRVVLTGYGADPLFSSRITVHFRELLRQKRFDRALADAARYLTVEGRLSRLYLRTRWRILFAPRQAQFGFLPPWLNDDFARRLNLRDRWEHFAATVLPGNAVRPEAHEVTFAPFWPDLFNSHDAGVTGVPVEVRHPFFDLRLMNYLLALPRLPWCCDKELLREAARGVLPDAVRLRRKSPLRADPLLRLLQRPEAVGINRFVPLPELGRYIAPDRIPQTIDTKDVWSAWVHLGPLSLNYWLRGLSPSAIHARGGAEHDFSIAGHS
jgi:asparagine synthase (glutamine-hydrolysing)